MAFQVGYHDITLKGKLNFPSTTSNPAFITRTVGISPSLTGEHGETQAFEVAAFPLVLPSFEWETVGAFLALNVRDRVRLLHRNRGLHVYVTDPATCLFTNSTT